jgi:cysteinyl-tRNA synthetase
VTVLHLAGRPVPVVGRARMYVCGITPYDTTHLGHAATFVWGDVAARVLRHTGVEVAVCRNVTDVDDVLDAAAARAGSRFDSFAAVQQFRFDRDMAALGVRRPTHEPRAHNHVGHVVALAEALLEVGAAYERGGSVWFRGVEVPARAGLDATTARALAREFGEDLDDVGSPQGRDDWADVAVWRAAGPDAGTSEPAWPSPWGGGRPGWHAECAAMALTTFGPSLDLHVGGVDLRFPHHAYEAAMAETVTGVRPFARAWLHVGTVQVAGEKMAKSAGNLVLVSEVVERYPPAVLRLLLVDRPWAEPWDFEPDALNRAAARLERLYAAAARGTESAPSASRAVTVALSANLDVPAALAVAETDGGAAARLALSVLGLS